MQKQARISLKTNDDNIEYNKAIEFKNNKINYLEDATTNVLFDIDKKLLIRDTKDIYLEYDFLNKKGLIYIKELKSESSVDIEVEKIIIEDSLIEIIYNVDNNNYHYMIEME